MFLKLFLLVFALVAVAGAGLGIRLLISKTGKFPETHIGRNKRMQERGIHCANTTDTLERQNYRPVELREKEAE